MFQINKTPPMYDPNAVQHMRDELLYVGVEELLTPQQVDEVIGAENNETVFVIINSVCGCAAGSARPSVAMALQNDIIPTKYVSLFAGQERDAIEHFRKTYVGEVPPSSPSMYLFKNGKLVFNLPRFQIEGQSAQEIAAVLTEAYKAHCSNIGPSISKEDYDKLIYAQTCGSKIPLNKSRA